MYQPKTGKRCSCKRGVQRDNCPICEGTGWQIDFQAIRNNKTANHIDGYDRDDLGESPDY